MYEEVRYLLTSDVQYVENGNCFEKNLLQASLLMPLSCICRKTRPPSGFHQASCSVAPTTHGDWQFN